MIRKAEQERSENIEVNLQLLEDFVELRGEGREIYNHIFYYLRHCLGDYHDAEDVLSLTHWQAIKKGKKEHKYDPHSPFRPWIFRVATNQAIDYDRKRKRWRRDGSNFERRIEPNFEGEGYMKWEPEGDYPEPLKQLEDVEQREIVKLALGELSPKYKDIITLVYFLGLKYREAAEILGIPVGTVKSRLSHGIRELEVV